MVKNFGKFLILTLCMVSLCGTIVAAADTYQGSFTFDFDFAIVGSTNFSLSNNRAYISSNGNSYRNGAVITTKYHYEIDLIEGGWFGSNYSGSIKTADGNPYSTYYNSGYVIDANNYTVNIEAQDDLTSANARIIGQGSLYQY